MDNLINYAFISYKRINPDEQWAKALHRQLVSWYIPTDIAPEQRLNGNKTISPIIRDKDSFPPGNGLSETIRTALRQSRTLILILSKKMIEDQTAKRETGEQAYIFDEIDYFLSLGRPRHAIIPVYIDTDQENPSAILPPMLRGYDQLVLNTNDYRLDAEGKLRSKTNWAQRTAAAVAAGIFGKDQDLFWNFHRRAVHRFRIRAALSAGLPLLAIVLFFCYLWIAQTTRTRIVETYQLIGQSRQADKALDTQAALIFALEAYEKSPDLNEALSNLRRQAVPDSRKPRTILPGGVVVSRDGTELLYYDPKTSVVRILRTNDLSEVERVGHSGMHIWEMDFSPDSKRVALLGGDSLRIYDRESHKRIYAHRHRYHMVGFSSLYHTLFDPSGTRYIQLLSDLLIQLNIDTGQSDTLTVKGYIHDVQQVEDRLFVGFADSVGFGIYQYDYENIRLYPVLVVPGKPQNTSWTFHAATQQIAYVVNDSLYRISPRNRQFCGMGSSFSFDKTGDRLLWKKGMNDATIFLTDSSGYTKKESYYGNGNLNTARWGRDNDVLLLFDNLIKIVDAAHPYQEKCSLILPRAENIRQLKSIVTDSLLLLTDYAWNHFGDEAKFLAYDYPQKHNFEKEKSMHLHYTFDGRFCIYEADYNQMKCMNTATDSVIWQMHAIPSYSETPLKHWLSPGRRSCSLRHNFQPIEHGFRSCGMQIVDIPTGKVLFERDSVTFDRYLSDDVIVYGYEDSMYVTDLRTRNSLCIGRLNNGTGKNSDFAIDYAKSRNICAAADSLNACVFDLSSEKELFKTPLPIKDAYTTMVKMAPRGDYLLVNQMYRTKDDDNHNRSALAVWNIETGKASIQDSLDEMYYNRLMTEDGYLFLTAWDRIAIFNFCSGKHFATIRLEAKPWNFVQHPNGHILVGLLNDKVFEIDLKCGKIIRQKLNFGGMGSRILGGHYIMSGNKLIDLNTDKPVMQIDQQDFPISIQGSVMVLQKHISATQQQEIITPFENGEELVRRVRRRIGKRILTPEERLGYQE